MENKRRQYILLSAYTNICRFVLAAVFIFAGFVKANDPLGFNYKLVEYSVAFGLTEWTPDWAVMPMTLAAATVEFTLGVYMLLGINRRFTSFVLSLMMGAMTAFTFYLALANPVSDCGCFGDAIVLTNWQTFGKNVILLVAAVSVFRWRRLLFRVITRKTEWLVSVCSVLYVVFFSYYCLQHLPVFDFRPYRVGTDIAAGMVIPEGEEPPVYETLFIMEKDGRRKEFTADNYPDASWAFVDRRTVLKKSGYVPPIHDFELVRLSDGETVTEEVLADTGYTVLAVGYRVEQADDGSSDLVNEMYEYCRLHGYTFYFLTASQEEEVELWKDRTGAEYPFCYADETTLKTMLRANPGIVLLKGGVVVNKWSTTDIPDEYMLTGRLEELPWVSPTWEGWMQKVAMVLMWFIGPMLVISLLDNLWKLFCRYREKGRRQVRND